MNAKTELMKEIFKVAKGWNDAVEIPEDSQIEETYDALMEDWELQDETNDVRCSGTETNLEAPYSRHFEANQVAMQVESGRWVSWTYWYGGGKHANPEEIDWLEGVFYVDCVEEEKTVIVRTFSKQEDPQ